MTKLLKLECKKIITTIINILKDLKAKWHRVEEETEDFRRYMVALERIK